MKTVHIGIIGCGGFGNFHLDNLLKVEGVEIDALVNGGRERLERTAKKVPGARLYQSYEEMFEKETGLDAVVICVTPERHAEIERTAARKGVHLYVEKPIGLSLEEAEKTQRIIEENGTLTSVGYQERYNPELEHLKTVLAENPAAVVTASWIGGMPGVAWWRKMDQSGGQLVEQCTHLFDMLRYLFGDMKTVYANARHDLHPGVENCDVDDCSVVNVTFESGLIGSIITACHQDERAEAEIGFTAYTAGKTIRYRWDQFVNYEDKLHEDKVKFERKHHFYAIQAFVEAVRSGDGSLIKSSYGDAVKSLAATLAANRSIVEQKPIELK